MKKKSTKSKLSILFLGLLTGCAVAMFIHYLKTPAGNEYSVFRGTQPTGVIVLAYAGAAMAAVIYAVGRYVPALFLAGMMFAIAFIWGL